MKYTQYRKAWCPSFRSAVVLSILLLVGCSCRFLPVGADASRALGVEVGLRVETTVELVAMVVSDREPSKADHIHMTQLPGFGGPEVLKTIQVPPRRTFEIAGVRRSDSGLCSAVFATLRADPALEAAGLEVWIQLHELRDGGGYSLDPGAFKVVSPR